MKAALWLAIPALLVGCAGDSGADPAPSPSSSVVDRIENELEVLLRQLGANVDAAPPRALTFDGATLCNEGESLDDAQSTTPKEATCFVEPPAATSAVLVTAFSTEEGEPIVRVQRHLPEASLIVVYEDSSRDTFGTDSWRRYECDVSDLERNSPSGSGDGALTC